MPQPLSTKENNLFKQVVKEYEHKNYKKGIKHADQILKKHPDHGETKAMKALIINSQGHSEEAFALAKEALRNDMKSHITWHVYGLLWRSQKNFEEASKAYKFALKIAPESQQIQRDLAWLQIQMRDYPGFVQTRTSILKDRPSIRSHWTAMAIAHHLSGELESAERTLSAYEENSKMTPQRSDVENSEAAMYKNTIIAEMGDTERALGHLESINFIVVDRVAWMEMRAKYLLQLGRMEEAEQAYRALLERNQEYRAYYDGLEKALGLDKANKDSLNQLEELYQSYAEKYERADAPRRIPLDFLEGDKFRQAVDSYLRRMLTRGVPSTFANVKVLYQDSSKLKTIQDLVEGYATEETPNGSAEKQANGSSSDKFQPSVTYFLALHYNYHLSRDLEKAMAMIEKNIEAAPKLVDYAMIKARILKHHGDYEKAAEVMNHARELDTKDRYINTKCAKYQLRNNENDKAIKTMSKFTRNETVGGPLGDLHDMQCMWFLAEDGEAYLRQGKLSLALKRFTAIHDIFDIWQEDQFDFHSFSLRKGQIRAYVDMLHWEDRLREHPFYSRAAINAIRVYLQLHEKPFTNGTSEMDGLDAKARKKAAVKAKKEQEKVDAERKEAEKKKKSGTAGDGEAKKEDPDPQGLKLVQTEKPLEDAMKFLHPLLEMSPKKFEGQIVGFEVFIRRKKYLLALKCLLAAAQINADHPAVHEQAVRFRKTVESVSEPLPEPVAKTIESTFKLVPKGTSLEKYNDDYLSKHKGSPAHVRSVLRVRQFLDSNTRSQNETDLQATLPSSSFTLDDLQASLDLLDEWKSDASVRDAFVESAKKEWPDATVLKKKH